MGLLHILPRLGESGGHIPHSSPFSYSRRLSPFFFTPPLLFSLHLHVGAALFCCRRWGGGQPWDPGRGTFGGADGAGGQCGKGEARPRSCSVRSGIQETPADSGTGVCVCVCVLPSWFCFRWEERDVSRSSSPRPDAADPIFSFFFFFKARWIKNNDPPAAKCSRK